VTGWLQPFAVLEPNKKLERTRLSNQTKQRLEPSPKWELEPTQPTQPQTKHTVDAACFPSEEADWTVQFVFLPGYKKVMCLAGDWIEIWPETCWIPWKIAQYFSSEKEQQAMIIRWRVTESAYLGNAFLLVQIASLTRNRKRIHLQWKSYRSQCVHVVRRLEMVHQEQNAQKNIYFATAPPIVPTSSEVCGSDPVVQPMAVCATVSEL